MNLFSKAGIKVVELRDYGFTVDLVLQEPIESSLFSKLYRQLLLEYNVLMIQLKDVFPIVRLLPYTSRHHSLYRYRWILTILTFTTVFLTGFGLSQSLYSLTGHISTIELILYSLSYTILFLTTLLSHELGHVFASRKNSIEVEGPVLIPAPPIQLGFIGTLGAVIFTKTPPPTRKSLAQLGISGPLTGFIIATLVGLLGLYLSPILPFETVEKLVETGEVQPLAFASLIFYLILGLKNTESGVLIIHPILFIAYIMYYITFLNLLPIGQLDGGHVVRSIIGSREFKFISTLTPIVFLVVGLTLQVLYGIGFVYIGIGLLTTILYVIIGVHGHPGVANQYDESKCKWCILTYIVLLVLTIPIPLT